MTLEDRVRRLETQNRRLLVVLTCTILTLFCFATLGAVEHNSKVVSATKFVLQDSEGKERAEWSTKDASAALQFLNHDGSRGLTLAATENGNALYIADQAGNIREGFSTDDSGTATLAIMRGKGKPDSFNLTDKPGATVIAFRDSKGNQRLNVGSTESAANLIIADQSDVPRLILGDQGVVNYDHQGKVTWASFGEDLTPEQRKRVMSIVNSEKAQE